MSERHQDPASTISYATARELVEEPGERGRRLLELFAEEQILPLERLRHEFGLDQNALNGLLGGLTRRFQKIQGDPGFHIYIPRLRAWAIGHTSRTHLRRALRAAERARQGRIPF